MPPGPPAAWLRASTVAVKVTPCPKADGLWFEVSRVDVSAEITDWVRVSALPANVSSPRYSALTVWSPTERLATDSVARPPDRVEEPWSTPSIVNWTMPSGVPTSGSSAVTVAVNVTCWWKADGFVDDATPVVVPTVCTVWTRASPLPFNVSSPWYAAVTVCCPTDRSVVESVACPLERAEDPMSTPSIRNWTLPPGVPACGSTAETMAVKTTF